MKNKKVKVYAFKKENDNYIITAETTDINLFNIDRILGKVRVKGRKTDFELIEIKSRHFNYDGTYLVKRKDLSKEVVTHFICDCDYCTRSKQLRPYEADLKDNELLNDLGITVFTYKRFASGDKTLYDEYFPVLSEYITDELKEKLANRSKEAMDEYELFLNATSNKPSARWETVKGGK